MPSVPSPTRRARPGLRAAWLSLFVVAAQPGQPRFAASSSRISQGDSVLLSWAVPDARSVFITGVGVVPATGQRMVAPERTREFVLVAPDRNDGRTVVSTEIQVERSSRGNDAEGPPFTVRRTFDARGLDLFTLLARIDSVLQRGFQYGAADWVRKPTGIWVIRTDLRDRPDLVLKQEARVALRRVAYRITINGQPKASKAFQCEIASAVQYRNRIESQFYPEQSDTLYGQQIDRLARSLGWLP